MFWGLVLEPGKRYSTTVEKSFHVSKAALDCFSVRNDNEILSVILETEGSEALLCNLCKQKGILQENLDLNFMTGDRLTFECRGHGRIHLSGYLLPDDDDEMSGMMGDEEEESEEDDTELSAPSSPEKSAKKDKRKHEAPPDVPPKKKKILTNDNEEEGQESDQDDESDLSDFDDEDLDDEGDDDEEASDSDEEEAEADEEDVTTVVLKQQKQIKQEPKTPNKQNVNTPKTSKTPVTNGVTPKEQKSNKKTPGSEKSPNPLLKQKQLLDNGVIIKELRIGNGAPVKPGKTVEVYYTGRLKDTNKIFDRQMKGDGFKFKVGKGEVIKGWDIGLQGMKVGGKRTITCPPDAAYGAKGIGPKIPPNSTLIFEVELKNLY